MLNRNITFQNSKLLLTIGSGLALLPMLLKAQAAPPVILAVDLENLVYYWDDVADRSKLATNPSITTQTPNAIGQLTFQQNVWLADIVAVNGTPVKGTFVTRTQNLNYKPAPVPGQSIADINRSGGPGVQAFEILDTDGTPIGTIWVEVLVGGPPPPGSPTAITGMNGAIVGGTGAFLGARGQCGLVTLTTRSASETEDPAMRRVNGGGKARLLLYVLPMYRPSIITTPTGSAVVHSNDFTPVTSTRPAKGGEILSIFATGLGPVRSSLDPGMPFPANPPATVNSPVKVTMDGVSADVLGAVGYPGSTDGYQVNFRVPTAVHGTVALQVSAAWMASPAVNIAVQ